jgi:beta-galactosidase/beta-glucuronidase
MHRRERYRSLNGPWQFATDDEAPIRGNHHNGTEDPFRPVFTDTIHVPFCPQSEASGVALQGHHPVLWYRRTFTLSDDERSRRVLLHFGAVDFLSEVWVNGAYQGSHYGGYTPFRFDITHVIGSGENVVELRVTDEVAKDQPRGKQSWQAPFSCWYHECSGIWQSVWLEFAPLQGIDTVTTGAHILDGGRGRITIGIRPFGTAPSRAIVTASRDGEILATREVAVTYPHTGTEIDLATIDLWSPDSPVLYDVAVRLVSTTDEGPAEDRVDTYTAFRDLSITDGALAINGTPLYQRLILDQGFWTHGFYTAPTDDDYRRDIELAIAMGFNGCRKHAKIEDPRFYYWADRLGFLVWEELPSPYVFSRASREYVMRDTSEMIRRDRGHPSVVAWTLYNESWGIPEVAVSREQQDFVRDLVRLVRQLDPTRPVVANDGWEIVGGDVYGVHSYSATAEQLQTDLDGALQIGNTAATIASSGKTMWPIAGLPSDRIRMVTEFGGIAFRTDHRTDAWGYDRTAESEEEFLARFSALVGYVRSRDDVAGFVYTQLTDVEQEVNGLLTADRVPKVPIEKIRRIITGETN